MLILELVVLRPRRLLKSTYPRTRPCTLRIPPFPSGAPGRVVLERTWAGKSLEIQGVRGLRCSPSMRHLRCVFEALCISVGWLNLGRNIAKCTKVLCTVELTRRTMAPGADRRSSIPQLGSAHASPKQSAMPSGIPIPDMFRVNLDAGLDHELQAHKDISSQPQDSEKFACCCVHSETSRMARQRERERERV